MRKTLFIVILVIVLLLSGCERHASKEPEKIFLYAPFEESGDSRLLDTAVALYNSDGDVELPIIFEDKSMEGAYLLKINGEEYAEVSLSDDMILILPGDYFEKNALAELRFYKVRKDKGTELRNILKVEARKKYPVDEAVMQDPLLAAKHFLVWSYSSNSALLSTEILSDDAVAFGEALQCRQKLLALRREKMGNEKALMDFDILISEVVTSEDLAFVFVKSREEFYYLDEPLKPAAIATRYFVVLTKENGNWKVLWCTRHAASDVKTDVGGFISVFQIPFLAFGEESVFEMDPADYSAQELRVFLNDLEYFDFEQAYRWEDKNIEKELAERQSGLPKPSEELEKINREEMLRFVENHALDRSGEWPDYTFYGGNCQNFASQVLHAGQIPMIDSGKYPWYYYARDNRSYAWSYVDDMMELLENNMDSGLTGVRLDNRNDLEKGDLVYIDWDMDGGVDHVMIVIDTGSQPRIGGNTEDAYNKRLTDYSGEKYYFHLQGIRP